MDRTKTPSARRSQNSGFLGDPDLEPGERSYLDQDSASKKDSYFYPENESRLRTNQLIGERLDPGKMKLNFLLFGVIRGRNKGAVVLYDTGAGSCLFETRILEDELEAAPLIGAKKIKLVSASGGKIIADPWEVSFPLKDPNLENRIEKVCGVNDWKLPVWDLSEERETAFQDNYEQFRKGANKSITNITIASDFGDYLHGIIGTNVKHLFPKEIATLNCGLTLFSSTLLPHSDAFEYLIGGPVEVFCANFNTDVLNGSCVESSFMMVQQCRGSLGPEAVFACISSDISESDEKTGEVITTNAEEPQEAVNIEFFESETDNGLVDEELENVVQLHKVLMKDCENEDALRHNESSPGDSLNYNEDKKAKTRRLSY